SLATEACRPALDPVTAMLYSWRNERRELAVNRPPMPIIIGAPRSGTTLLRLMMDSHSELAIPPETGFLALAPKLAGGGAHFREKFFTAVTTFGDPAPSWPDFEIAADEFWDALIQIEP